MNDCRKFFVVALAGYVLIAAVLWMIFRLPSAPPVPLLPALEEPK